MEKTNSKRVALSQIKLEKKYHDIIEWILQGNAITSEQEVFYNKREKRLEERQSKLE